MIKILLVGLLILFALASLIFIIRSRIVLVRAKRKLRKMDLAPSDKWTPDFLEDKRKLTDPFADETVKEIMRLKEKGHINQMFDSIVRDKDHLTDKAPEALRSYFEESAGLPEWADPDLISLGQQMYVRHGFWISLLLSYKSLPECYACSKGAEVLHKTARLEVSDGNLDTYSRRIAETAQFVLFSMSPGAFKPNGKGIMSAQKVRLIHAVIRYHLLNQNWDVGQYDQPINQEDMAGTLMSFSALILEGLEQIGIRFSQVEKEAYIHCWRVVGHLVGLDAELIPLNAADASKLGHAILDHQIGKSKQGTKLTEALLIFMNAKSKAILKPESNIALIHFFMGEHISEILNVPEKDYRIMEKLVRKLRRIARTMEILDKSMVFAMLVQVIARIGMQYTINKMTPNKVITFYIPKSLKKDWITKKD